MELDQENAPQQEKPRPAGAVWLVWMFLGIVPIPIGLMIGPINIFNSSQGLNKSILVCYAAVTVILSLICGIGLCGGFRSRDTGSKVISILGGIILGFAITGINLCAVFLVGCASAFSHM